MPLQSDTNFSQLQNYLNEWTATRPVSHWGATNLTKPLSLEFYKQWLDQGYHSTMTYLQDHLPLKAEPAKLGTKLRSALVFAFPYFPHPEKNDFPLKHVRTALYAQGKDYHFWIKDHLSILVDEMRAQFPDEEFLVFTDSAPVMERDLAYRAGLGWIGKNTCLIDPKKGSLFLIGEVFTSLDLKAEPKLAPDFCGTCQACIQVCPTKAIKSPKLLDANLCISYWTIESREVPPENVRPLIGDWFFGCDLCQTVCPWNQKVFKAEIKAHAVHPRPVEDRQVLLQELKFILNSSGKTLTKTFKGTPLMRAGPFGLKRNALIVAANMKFVELKDEMTALLDHEKLGELAKWTLEKISGE
jgi:epoxyqueuosine reductase